MSYLEFASRQDWETEGSLVRPGYYVIIESLQRRRVQWINNPKTFLPLYVFITFFRGERRNKDLGDLHVCINLERKNNFIPPM